MKRRMNVRKAAAYAIGINSLQIVLVGALAVYILLEGAVTFSTPVLRMAVAAAALLATWGAVVDIREARSARRLVGQIDAMDDSIERVEDLNRTLRAQRHDFMNHLQVVYSLMEMEEYAEASDYIERVYGDMMAVSRVIKTANPSINALLQAKTAECERAGIALTLDITSAWKDLPVPGWEMCRILGNLIDNAADALRAKAAGERKIAVALGEDFHNYRFCVENNGPAIEPDRREAIFEPGVSSKGEGRGMGLFIVRKIMREYGGDIMVESDAGRTAFAGFVPRGQAER